MGGKTAAVWNQQAFRFRNDDGSESAATWSAVAGSPAPALPLDTAFRLRFLLQETAGSNQSETPTWVIQYRVSTDGATFGSWTNVGTSTPVIYAASAYALNVAATQQLGSGTFRDGDAVESTGTTPAEAATAGNDEYEAEYTLSFSSTNGANVGDIYEFRIVLTGGTTLNSYTSTPQVIAGDSSSGIALQKLDGKSANQSSSNSLTSNSFTPADNSLLVVIMSVKNVGPNPTTLSNQSISDTQSLTWTKDEEVTHQSFDSTGVSIWSAPVTSGASMTVTVNSGGGGTGSLGQISITVLNFVNTASAGDIAAIQSFTDGATGGGRSGSYSGTLSASCTAGDVLVAGSASNEATGGDASAAPGTNWVQAGEYYGSETTANHEFRNDEYTGTAVDYSTLFSGSSWSVGAVEYGPAQGGVEILPPVDDIAIDAAVPAAAAGKAVTVPVTDVAIAVQAPLVGTSALADVPVTDIAVAAASPALAAGASASAPSSDIATATAAPVLAAGKSADVPASDVALDALSPSVGTSALADVPASDIVLGVLAPEVAEGSLIAVPAANIVIDALAPLVPSIVNIRPPADNIAVAVEAPGVGTGALIVSPVADIAVSGHEPSLATGKSVEPPTTDVVLVAPVPVLAAGAGVVAVAPDIAIAAHEPLVGQAALIDVPAVDISVASEAPSASSGASASVPFSDIATSAVAPSAASGGAALVPAADIAIASPAPASVLAGANANVPASDIVLFVPKPTIYAVTAGPAGGGEGGLSGWIKRRRVRRRAA